MKWVTGRRESVGESCVWGCYEGIPLGNGARWERPANTEKPISFVRFSLSWLVEGGHPLYSNFVLVYFLLLFYVFVGILKNVLGLALPSSLDLMTHFVFRLLFKLIRG